MPAWEATTRGARPTLTEIAAAEFVAGHGRDGVGILEERAELAQELGHKLAAATWRAMAEAAARLVGAAGTDPIVAARPLSCGRSSPLDDELFKGAEFYTGLHEKSALIREAPKALVERKAARRLARLGGTAPDLKAIPRRRMPRR